MRAAFSPQLPMKVGRAVLIPFLFGIGVPLLMALLLGVSPIKATTFIALVVVLEYGAIPFGLGLQLPAAFVWITVVSEGVALFLAATEFLGLLRELAWVSRFVSGIQKRLEGSRLFRSYGMMALAPAVFFFSVKGCATVAWLSGWPRYRALAVTLAGFATVTTVVLLSSLGLFRVFLSGG